MSDKEVTRAVFNDIDKRLNKLENKFKMLNNNQIIFANNLAKSNAQIAKLKEKLDSPTSEDPYYPCGKEKTEDLKLDFSEAIWEINPKKVSGGEKIPIGEELMKRIMSHKSVPMDKSKLREKTEPEKVYLDKSCGSCGDILYIIDSITCSKCSRKHEKELTEKFVNKLRNIRETHEIYPMGEKMLEELDELIKKYEEK